METRYDSQADAVLILFGGQPAGGTVDWPFDGLPVAGEVLASVDVAGHLRGIEILGASRVLAADVIERIAGMAGDDQTSSQLIDLHTADGTLTDSAILLR